MFLQTKQQSYPVQQWITKDGQKSKLIGDKQNNAPIEKRLFAVYVPLLITNEAYFISSNVEFDKSITGSAKKYQTMYRNAVRAKISAEESYAKNTDSKLEELKEIFSEYICKDVFSLKDSIASQLSLNNLKYQEQIACLETTIFLLETIVAIDKRSMFKKDAEVEEILKKASMLRRELYCGFDHTKIGNEDIRKKIRVIVRKIAKFDICDAIIKTQ